MQKAKALGGQGCLAIVSIVYILQLDYLTWIGEIQRLIDSWLHSEASNFHTPVSVLDFGKHSKRRQLGGTKADVFVMQTSSLQQVTASKNKQIDFVRH